MLFYTLVYYIHLIHVYIPSIITDSNNVGKKENVVRYYICPRYVLYVIYYLSSILTTVLILSSVLTNISRLKITKIPRHQLKLVLSAIQLQQLL